RLRLLPEQPDELGNGIRALANDTPRLPLRWVLERDLADSRAAQLRVLLRQRLLLRRHDSLEGSVAWLVRPLGDGEDARSGELDHLHPTLDGPLRRDRTTLEAELRDRGSGG